MLREATCVYWVHVVSTPLSHLKETSDLENPPPHSRTVRNSYYFLKFQLFFVAGARTVHPSSSHGFSLLI